MPEPFPQLCCCGPGLRRAEVASATQAGRSGGGGCKIRPGKRRLEENIGAAAIELTPYDLREIERAASKIKAGAHHPEQLETLTGR